MPATLFAACRAGRRLTVRRIVQDRDAQEIVQDEFDKLYEEFMDGVERDIQFNGNWKPDEDELFTVEVEQVPELESLIQAVTRNSTAVEELDAGGLTEARAKALFIGGPGDDSPWILAQLLNSRQILKEGRFFVFTNRVYRIVTEPAFSLGDSLTFIVEDGLVKFKSLQALRQILDTRGIYEEATREDVRRFAEHHRLFVADVDEFVRIANQPIRRLIGEVVNLEVLDLVSPKELQEIAAQRESIPFELDDKEERLIMPTNARDARKLLVFLSEHDFHGAITGNEYVTNSRRRA